jgi:hypothetical protein
MTGATDPRVAGRVPFTDGAERDVHGNPTADNGTSTGARSAGYPPGSPGCRATASGPSAPCAGG